MRFCFAVLMSSAAVLTACQPAAPAAEAPVAVDEPAPAEAIDFSMPFNLQINFSPAAAAKLAETGERVKVDAMYYAEPKDETVAGELEAGDPGVWLGTEELFLEGADGLMPVPGYFENGIAAEKTTGPVRALVNVYSAREKSADNILSCGIVDETLEALSEAATPSVIACALIEE